METIGMLGGMGSYATVEIFRRLVDAFPAEKEWERPHILIDNNCTMPSRVRAILYDENRDVLVNEMKESVEWLVRRGATKIIIGCITAHHFLPELPHKDRIINAVEETVRYIPKGDVVILCTEGTIEVGIWDKALAGCNVIYPDDNQMVKLRGFIETVKKGEITAERRQEFKQFVDSFSYDTIVLGCTELPILWNGISSKKQIIDPIQCVIDVLR